MNKRINVKDKEKAIKALETFKNKKYENIDIKFENVHLKKLNNLIRKKIFSKNDLYISSDTLWELMQPQGKREKHNYHNLYPADIIDVLNSITEPDSVMIVGSKRYLIITTQVSHFAKNIFVVIDINSKLSNNVSSCVNKIVTIYPKSNKESYINKHSNKSVLLNKK